VHLHKTGICSNLGGCTCDKLHVIKKPNAMTVVIMNLFRGHKKCYFTILPTLIFEQFRQVPKFDRADFVVAHKLTKRIANIKFVELRKIHYNVMSRVMDMNEAVLNQLSK
jgi:intergrase/recombinase